LEPVREFGRGDGPFGAFAPDRFWFQRGGSWQSPDQLSTSLALGPSGQFAVVDERRTLMFDGSGKNLWYTIGVFGNCSKPSFSTQNRRFWDTACDLSFLLNEKDGTWQPEALWDHSALTPQGCRSAPCSRWVIFADGKQAFFVAISPSCGAPFGPAKGSVTCRCWWSADRRFQDVARLTVTIEDGKPVMREDTNGDGQITRKTRRAGRGCQRQAVAPHGVQSIQRSAARWQHQHHGRDADDLEADRSQRARRAGVRWQRTTSAGCAEWRQAISPYDFKPDGENFFVVTGTLADAAVWCNRAGAVRVVRA